MNQMHQPQLINHDRENTVSLSLSKTGCKLSRTGFDKLNLTAFLKKETTLLFMPKSRNLFSYHAKSYSHHTVNLY